ncbi:MAG: arylsulfatase [Phycisphaerales bacterium]|nr:MAG: arylsulfatase [Phycisphaerales bacterium]
MSKETVMGKQTRREFLKMTGFAAASATASSLLPSCAGVGQMSGARENRPNIIFILADDLGYGDLGCYGQQEIATPNIDRIAAEGMRFTDHYAGSTVCAPSRCALMVGQHTGHCLVRGNARVPLRPSDFTVAELLKEAGYATGIIGKWGLGEADSTGIPNKQGFDYWFGYLNQRHAHNYYPEYLWRNEEKVELANQVNHVIGGQDRTPGGVATKRVDYSHDLFAEEALNFVEKHKDKPFFLYLAYTIPHANNEARFVNQHGMEVPDYGIYADKDWPEPQKGHAAMITRMDRDIGKLMARLKALGLDEDTLVMFSSDNGPHKEGQADPAFFKSWGSLRGYKRALYEGGIRVPMIARWPGRIKAGSVSSHVSAFWDFLPTCAELIGVKAPPAASFLRSKTAGDGISMVPTLLGRPARQKKHEFLYWEFHEQGKKQAVRVGDWKGVRLNVAKDPEGPIELYNLKNDIGEEHNVASQHPQIVAKIEKYMKSARTPSEHWPLPGQ